MKARMLGVGRGRGDSGLRFWRSKPVIKGPHCFSACEETAHQDGSLWQTKTTHLMTRQQREVGEDEIPKSPSRAHPQ